MAIKDNEVALLTKILEDQELYKAINSDVGKNLVRYPDVWQFIVEYHSKYKQTPTLETVEKKFSDFAGEDVDKYSLEYLLDEVQTDYIRERGSEIMSRVVDLFDEKPREAVEYAFQKMSSLLHDSGSVQDVNLSKDFEKRVNNLKERIEKSETNDGILGISTGIPPIDYIFGGWQPGDFIVVMGWTGSAKTWLSSHFAVKAWQQNKNVLYFSLEMDDLQYGARFDVLADPGKWSNISLLNGRGINVNAYEKWAGEFFENTSDFILVTNESANDVNQLTVASKIEQYNPDIVIMDYHGLMDDYRKGFNETEKAKNISRDFKKMAGKYHVPIIDIAGVTQEDGHGERFPRLNEIAWAKAIAYDADLVLSVWKEGQTLHVDSAKKRRGSDFAFDLSMDLDRGILTPMDWDQ